MNLPRGRWKASRGIRCVDVQGDWCCREVKEMEGRRCVVDPRWWWWWWRNLTEVSKEMWKTEEFVCCRKVEGTEARDFVVDVRKSYPDGGEKRVMSRETWKMEGLVSG